MIKKHIYCFCLSLFYLKDQMFCCFGIHRYFIHFVLKISWIHHTFLVILFAWYKKYIIWQISFRKFPDVLPTCARVVGNLWRIYLGLHVLRWVPKRHLFSGVCFVNETILLSKQLRTFCLLWKLYLRFYKSVLFLILHSGVFN